MSSERLQVFWNRCRLFYRAYHLLYQVKPIQTIGLALLMLVQGSIPPLATYLSKLTLDGLFSLQDQTGSDLVWLVVWWGSSMLVGQLIEPWSSFLLADLNDHLTADVNRKLVRKANSFQGLEPFEHQAFYEDLEVLNRQSSHRPLNLMVATIHWLRLLVTLVGLMLLVGSLVWWIPVLLLVCGVPGILRNAELRSMSWKGLLSTRKEALEINHFRSLLTQEASAREIRIYNLGGHFEERLMGAFQHLYRVMHRDRLKLAHGPMLTVLLSASAALFSFGWVLVLTLQQKLTAGSLLILVQTLGQLQQLLDDFTVYTSLLGEHILYFEKLFVFLDHQETLILPEHPIAVPAVLREGIRFDRVGFTYPDGREVLQDVSFTIRAGETVALVGENGAGKSTLIKLLCRFYDPTSGSITVDGQDLRNLDLQGFRSRMGAVFQDFGKYPLTVQENIWMGDLSHQNPERALQAARRSGFRPEVLPAGMQTLLGKSFGGTELSGGQWQKLAIARAFYRDPDILILDEPTAAIDPRAEHDLYQQFAHLSQGKTVILVTHRLASVQMADRILVLKGGRLIEQGTHQDLLEHEGEYATMFRLQAQYYQMDSEESIGA